MHYLRIFSLILILSCAGYSQKLLTLDEAVKIALNQNTGINKAINNVKTSETKIKSTYGKLLPSVTANAGWDWSHKNLPAGSAVFGGNSYPYEASSNNSYTYSAGVDATTTLYDGLASYKNLDISENNFQASKYDLQRAKQDLIYIIVSNYYSIINALETVSVREEDLKWNQKNLEIISERNKLGSGTLADVYQQQVKVGTAELELIKAKNSYETLKNNFLYTLGLDVLADYKLEKPETQLNMVEQATENLSIEQDVNQLIIQAIERRTDVLSSKIKLENASKNVDISSAANLPSISNSISYIVRGDAVSTMLDTRTLSFGLNVQYPIFHGWSISTAIQQAQIEVKNKELDVKDLERQIKKDLQKNVLDLQTVAKKLDVGKKNVKAAEETRRIEQEKYNLGATTLLNVLISNSDYTNAVTNYINSKFEYLTLKQQLEYNLGITDFTKYEK